jgi:hypothetical protein
VNHNLGPSCNQLSLNPDLAPLESALELYGEAYAAAAVPRNPGKDVVEIPVGDVADGALSLVMGAFDSVRQSPLWCATPQIRIAVGREPVPDILERVEAFNAELAADAAKTAKVAESPRKGLLLFDDRYRPFPDRDLVDHFADASLSGQDNPKTWSGRAATYVSEFLRDIMPTTTTGLIAKAAASMAIIGAVGVGVSAAQVGRDAYCMTRPIIDASGFDKYVCGDLLGNDKDILNGNPIYNDGNLPQLEHIYPGEVRPGDSEPDPRQDPFYFPYYAPNQP